MEGIEPTLSCENRILSPARLPVPPHRPMSRDEVLNRSSGNASDTQTGRTQICYLLFVICYFIRAKYA
jgi:hypothetical protein